MSRALRSPIFIVVFLLSCGPGLWAALLDEAVWFTRPVGAGVTWKFYHFDNLFGGRQSVSITEVDLNNPNVVFRINHRDSYVGPSPGTSSPDYPRAYTSTMAAEIPNAKAAVNGTYFNTASYNPDSPLMPWGGGTTFLRINGSTIHAFDGSNVNSFSMGILFNSRADFSILKKSGNWSGRTGAWNNMMVSGPVLLTNKVVETYDPGNNHANLRHPRTAVGKINATNKVLFVTVDGRTEQAAGMSCTELAKVMLALGCDNAINLDGGGSTTMWAKGEPFSGVVNYPTDNGIYDHLGQRRAANALIVTSTDPVKPAFDARMTSLDYTPLTRSGEIVQVKVKYTNIGTQTWTGSNVKIVPSRALGRNSSFIPAEQTNSFFSMSPATVAPGVTATFTLNLKAPAVANNTNFEENFVLSNTSTGYFGPPDGDLKARILVRPPITLPPPVMIVQGTLSGPNNQWYLDGPAGWNQSSVSFSAPGVANEGQRYCAATVTNRYADFIPMFDVAGVYKVEAAWPYSSNNITSVRYTINHLNGTQNVFKNQNNPELADSWQLLGNFPLSTGISGLYGVHSVRVSNGSTTGNRFYSGAIRFTFVSPLAAIRDWSLY